MSKHTQAFMTRTSEPIRNFDTTHVERCEVFAVYVEQKTLSAYSLLYIYLAYVGHAQPSKVNEKRIFYVEEE